jgi:hypothetical protein
MHRVVPSLIFVVALPCLVVNGFAQEKQKPPAAQAKVRDVDPLALEVLHAVSDPLSRAQVFSFKALIGEEQLASDGQLVTFFHSVDIVVQRPDKVHLVFKGQGEETDFYGVSGSTTMYSPESKVFAQLPAKATIDDNLTALNAKGVEMPIGPFLRSNFYEMVAKQVTKAYVVGRVNVFGEEVHQLAFSGPDADWQLWVTGGENPRFVRAEIVNKTLPGKPRTTIQFLDWNLNPDVPSTEFSFTKPAGAHEITLLTMTGGK